MKQLFQRTRLLKFTVRLFQDLLVLIVQPITLTFINSLHSLSIKLPVIDSDIRIDGSSHLNTDETATSAGIRQQIFLIARADKGSITTHLADSITIRFPQVGDRLLQ